MARVESWFWGFVERHLARHPRPDWPPLDGEFWETFRLVLVKHGVAEDVADGASRAMAEEPPPYLGDHLAAFLKQVRALWDARRAAAGGAATDRAEAERLSAGCDDCLGNGVTHRWRRHSVGSVGSDGKPVAPFVLLYCRCPFGRWAERAHRERAPDVRRRLYDLADHPWLWGPEYRDPPDPRAAPAVTALAPF